MMFPTYGLTEFGGWDWVRAFNFVLGVAALIIMATRVQSWLRLPPYHRIHWLSTTAFVGSVTYSNVELYLMNTGGGLRLVFLAAALVYVHIALHTARGQTAVVTLVPTTTTRKDPAMSSTDPFDPSFTPRDETPEPTESVDPVPTPPVSPKVTGAALGSLAAGVALALILGLSSPQGAGLVGGLPAWAQFVLLLAVPPIATFLAGFATPNSVSYLQPALRAARQRTLSRGR